MADLAKLDTTKVGFIGFWNALNHTSDSSIDPGEVLNYGDVVTYETYDNGVEGTLKNTSETGRMMNFRVKDDGWFLVWLDRTKNFGQTRTISGRDSTSNATGYWDILSNWTASDSSSTNAFPTTTLSSEINRLMSNLSNSGNITFRHSDVGHYSYDYGAANVVTWLYESGDSPSGRLAYESSVTRNMHAGLGSVWTGASGYNEMQEVGAANAQFAKTSGENNHLIGARDVVANNDMPNAQTIYQNYGNHKKGPSSAMTHHFFVLTV